MNESNPYTPTEHGSINDFGIRKVNIHPIELLKRSYALIGDQYWLFLGITVVGILVGSAVPMGLIMGAMMVGMFLCYIHREQGIRVEFATLFKGFDYFLESMFAMLMIVVAMMLVMIPFMIAMFLLMMAPLMVNGGNAQQMPIGALLVMIVVYPLMILVNLLVTMPFIFVFQLIVDRNVKAMAAVRLSINGVRKNFVGVLWFLIVMTLVSIPLMLMCYVPVLLFMPISFGALYLLYRDIYGPGIQFTAPNIAGPNVTATNVTATNV